MQHLSSNLFESLPQHQVSYFYSPGYCGQSQYCLSLSSLYRNTSSNYQQITTSPLAYLINFQVIVFMISQVVSFAHENRSCKAASLKSSFRPLETHAVLPVKSFVKFKLLVCKDFAPASYPVQHHFPHPLGRCAFCV